MYFDYFPIQICLILLFLDTVKISVIYEGSSMTFSDTNNPMFPSVQELPIPTGTTNIVLTCSLLECNWMKSDESGVTTIDSYIIPEISDSYSRTFSLLRMTTDGVSYTTAHVHIRAQVVTQSPSTLPTGVIIGLVLVISLAATIFIIIPLCIFFYRRKRNTIKRPEPSVDDKPRIHSYENFPQPNPSTTKEYLTLPCIPNRVYMTIDETTMIPLETLTEQKQRVYQNVASESTFTQRHENINKTNTMEPNDELNHTTPHRDYIPMSSVKEEKKIFPKFIPTKEFPATYQQYVASGIENDSLFLVEFTNLTEHTRINVDSETDEALKIENTTKNPFRNFIPFDENRVILDSPYFDCNYINASWLESYQFIATIHPTRATHRDFFQMIYQTEASMVIMLTTRKEKAKIISGVSNRVCYWPKKDEPINYDPFETTLVASTETNAFIKQEISLKNNLERKDHTFIQCISPIWNEDSTVADMTPVLVLLNRILKQIQEYPSKPIIIHCEDGISKTGILLSGINSVKELTHRKSINIYNSVKNLRRQRMKMIPTLVSDLYSTGA